MTYASPNAPFDLNHLHHFTDGDMEQEVMFYQIFIKQADEIIASIDQSFADSDVDMWVRAVHKLKGSAANLGARQLSTLCDQGEKSDFSDIDANRKLALDIKKEVEDIKAFMYERMPNA